MKFGIEEGLLTHASGTWEAQGGWWHISIPSGYNRKHLRKTKTMKTEPPALLLQCPLSAPGVPVLQWVAELSYYNMSTYFLLRCLCSLVRAPEAFVSIQLEKVGLRDMMLNAFLLRKETMADRMKNFVSLVRRTPKGVESSYCLLHLSK